MSEIEWLELYELFCEIKKKQDKIIQYQARIIQRQEKTIELYTKDDELYSDDKLKNDKNMLNGIISEYEYLTKP